MKYIYLLALLFAAGHVNAGGDLDKQAFQFSSFNGEISKQVMTARNKIEQIEYKEITSADRVLLIEKFGILENTSSSKQQSADAEASANEILARAFRDSKISCTFETPMGSNMKKRLCMTDAARERTYQMTQRDIQMKKSPSVPYISQ